jgi:hypothetical protein
MVAGPIERKMPRRKYARGSRNGMGDRARGLIDTGALLALLDRGDRWHRPCVDALSGLPLPLATSAAVLAELGRAAQRSALPSALPS